jgi:hypothetical protein
MTTDSNPEPEGADAGSEHERTGQHGPEMDDTQVEATGELRDELPPVTDDSPDDSSDDSSADAAG